jgi:ligand-binding sensor domain-containing protein
MLIWHDLIPHQKFYWPGVVACDGRGSPATPRYHRAAAGSLTVFGYRFLSRCFCRWFRVRLSCLTLLLVCGLAAAAQYSPSTDDYVMQAWNTDSGLPDSSVTSIAQTPDGYLWIGTLHGGLVRFDGTSFVGFDPGNTPELHSIEMHQLLVAPSGTLWIGNAEGGLISHQNGQFQFEYWNNDTPHSWVANIVAEHTNMIEFSSFFGLILRRTVLGASNRWETIVPAEGVSLPNLFADESGTIWYLTTRGCLAQLRGTNSVILRQPPGLAGTAVNVLTKDSSGRIWAATPNHLAYWNGQVFVDATPTNGPPEFNVQAMVPCPGGGFWMLCDACLRKFDGRQWTFIEQGGRNGVSTEWSAGMAQNEFTLLFAGSEGGAWFWRKPEGLGHISVSGRVSWVRDVRDRPLARIRCWCEDHEGNVWVGLGDGRLARLRPRLFHLVWPPESVDNEAANSVCQDEAGAMWFGTGGEKVLRWKNEAFQTFEPPITSQVLDTKVLASGDGKIWIGSVQNGLLEFEKGLFSFPFPIQSIGTVVRCLYRDRQGDLWIGNEFGLFRWNGKTLKEFTAQDGFTPAYVTAITGDPAGDLWMGTALGELRRLQDGKFQTFLPEDSLTDKAVLRAAASANPMAELMRGTLSGGERFWALDADTNGVLWIGSLGGGLLRFKDGRFVRFTTRVGLPSDHVSQILEDDRGRLWLGTRVGIVRADKAALNAWADGGSVQPFFDSYGQADGMPALECSGGSQPNCWRDRTGRLWFTTVRGAVWADSTVLRENRLPPPVLIEDVRVDGASLLKNGVASSPALMPASIRVEPGRHFVEFKFTALSFTSPDKVRFKSRLAGLDPKWLDGDGRRAAGYNYIPPGTYHFEVLACNNDGYWDENPASVEVSVMPFFWQRWWFRVAVVLAMLAVIFGFYFTRLSRLRALERLRLRIARDLHDEVGSNLGTISLLAQMMEQTPTPDDATQVRALAMQTVDTLRDIIWFIDPKHDQLGDLVARLEETARLMLGGLKYRFTQEGEFGSANVSLAFRRNVLPLFKEALHNILKHAHASEVAISVRRQDDRFEFCIQDNGTGFNPAQIRPGNGLRNLRKRTAEIGGQVEITSGPGTGTSIRFAAPITQTRDWFKSEA